MSSFELIELCEHLDDRGRFKAALRATSPGHPWLLAHWSEPAQAAFQAANELAVLRAAQTEAKSEDFGSTLFISPAKLLEMAESDREWKAASETVFTAATRATD